MNILIHRDLFIYLYILIYTDYYSHEYTYKESSMSKLPGHGGRVARALLQTVPGMRVALWQVRRRAGISGQTPSRGSPCPVRLHGRNGQVLLHLWTLLGSSNHPISRYVSKGEVGYHVGPLVQRVAAIVNSQGSPSQGMLLYGHRTSPER